MERFKAVEKAMKTKAYSKEGLSAAAKLDPKEQAKVEASEMLSSVPWSVLGPVSSASMRSSATRRTLLLRVF